MKLSNFEIIGGEEMDLHPLERKLISTIRRMNSGYINLTISVQNGIPMLIEATTDEGGIRVTQRHQLNRKVLNE